MLGHAALKLWPDLPRDVQELLFETAVPIDPTIRNSLAIVDPLVATKICEGGRLSEIAKTVISDGMTTIDDHGMPCRLLIGEENERLRDVVLAFTVRCSMTANGPPSIFVNYANVCEAG